MAKFGDFMNNIEISNSSDLMIEIIKIERKISEYDKQINNIINNNEIDAVKNNFILKMNKIIENMGDSMLEDSDTKKVLLKSIELMDEQQKVELYEHFHGGTFSTSQFYDWIEKDLS